MVGKALELKSAPEAGSQALRKPFRADVHHQSMPKPALLTFTYVPWCGQPMITTPSTFKPTLLAVSHRLVQKHLKVRENT